MRTEAGQHDRAIELVDEVAGRGYQNGFDEWVMVAASGGACARAIAALDAGETDSLEAHIQTLTAVVEAWRAANIKAWLEWYDGALARVLLAAGMKDAARERVDLALQMADETDWHMFDAELLRLRVSDDGSGGARIEDRGGLAGLAERVGTVDGRLQVSSPPGGPTTVAVELPSHA